MLKRIGTRLKNKKTVVLLFLLVPFFLFTASIVFSAKPFLYENAEFSWLIRDRHGKLLWLSLSEDQKYRCFTPLKQVPQAVLEATLLYEDRDFYQHVGVNFLSLGRALFSMAAGGRKLGASTVTMQLVRLSEQTKTDTVFTKLRQIWRAFIYEFHYTKDEILEAYLNLAPYGSNVEGIGAASLVWFHKNIQELNLAEIIALVTIPQNPSARNPLKASNNQWNEARKRLFALWDSQKPNPYNSFFTELPLKVFAPKDLPFYFPHTVLEIYANRPRKKERSFPEEQVVQTTLDLELQKELERTMTQYIADKKNYGIENGAMVLADWQTGEILSLLGSADFYNTRISGQVDGTNIPRSYGSTLKPFIYALALEQGLIHSKTVLLDSERSFAGYEPENADGKFSGPLHADEALKKSRNIPAIRLAERLSSPDLYEFLKKAGIFFPYKKEHYGLALVLGGAEIRLRDLAGLYAMLANRGFYRKLTYYAEEKEKEFPLLSSEASYITLKMLETKSLFPFSSVLSSWKTGTSNGQRDALAAGVFGPYVLTVWIGNFDASANPNFIGSQVALPLFFQAAETLQKLKPGFDKAWYTKENLNIKEIEVCASTGDIDLSLCANKPKTHAYFIPAKSPIKETGVLRKILINTQTGLRECKELEGITKEEVYEFWSLELQHLFAKAGIHKEPVPPYGLQCLQEIPRYQGNAPQIVSPVRGVSYQQDMKNSQTISLLADADADVDTVHWFVDDTYLGYTKKNSGLPYTPQAGVHTVYAVDEFGRSASLTFKVEKVSF